LAGATLEAEAPESEIAGKGIGSRAQTIAALRRIETCAANQPLKAAALQTTEVQALARSAKSSASLLCHARAVSVTAREAAIRSSTARRR